MSELLNVMKDIAKGALPVSEIPGFLGWALGKGWVIWIVLVAGAVLYALAS